MMTSVWPFGCAEVLHFFLTVTNVTFNLGSLDNYHGALTCVSANDGPSLTLGNVMVNVTPSPAFAGSLEIENGVRLTLSDIGELRADGLKLHDGAILRYAYSSATTSVIRVSSAFTIPEADGKVYLSFSSTIDGATDRRDFPLLIVPDTQELNTNSFVMCGITEPQWATGELVVVPDAVAQTKTLVWRVYGSRRLQTADSATYAANSTTGATQLKEGENTFVLKAHRPGALFRLEIRCGGGKAAVISDWPGCGVLADVPVLQFSKKGVRWFAVPAAAEEVRVQVSGNGAVDLLDSARKVVASRPNKNQMVVLRVKRGKTEMDEFWGVRLTDNIWINRVRIGSPALPILYASPESAIVRR